MKFRFKVMLYTILLLAFFYVTGSFLLITVSFSHSLDNERDAAVNAFRMIQNSLLLSGSTDRSDITDMTEQLVRQNDTMWTGVRLQNQYTNLNYYSMGELLYATTDEDETQMEEEQCYLIRYGQTARKYYLQVSGIVEIDDTKLILETCQDVTQVYDLRDLQLEIYQIVLLVILAAGSLASFFMASKLTRPIQQLAEASRKIADGNLSIRADIHSGAEIELLALDFNHMADKIEENIRQLAEAMRQQEEFMGSFAHELKTPMTSIIGYADLLRGQSLDQDEQQEAANYIFSEGRRLESLSLKLLDLLVLKKRDFELKEASLAELIQSVIRAVEPNYNKREIHIQGRCQHGHCMLEPDLVKSLIINLTDNAAKAMDHGGYILISGQLTSTGCVILVADNGRGMAKEELDRITEAFYRVDKSRSRAQGGAGLGLALCSEIVALHNGTMTFDSEPGKGTVVRVALNGGRPEGRSGRRAGAGKAASQSEADEAASQSEADEAEKGLKTGEEPAPSGHIKAGRMKTDRTETDRTEVGSRKGERKKDGDGES